MADKCENCSEHGMNLVPASTMDKAEDISQEVLDGVR